jgi:hypothetical protein
MACEMAADGSMLLVLLLVLPTVVDPERLGIAGGGAGNRVIKYVVVFVDGNVAGPAANGIQEEALLLLLLLQRSCCCCFQRWTRKPDYSCGPDEEEQSVMVV